MSTAHALRAPQARRLRKPSWRNPRLLIGALLVFASVGLVVLLVAAQDRTVPVYAADRQLSTGSVLDADDLRIVNVHLDTVADRYISAEAAVPTEAQLSRPVGEGELIPHSALVSLGEDGRQPVTVEVDHALSSAVEAGRLVDLWAVSDVIAAAAEVVEIRESSSSFGTGGGLTIELLVDSDELPDLLEAQGRGDALTVLLADMGNQ